MLINKCGIKNLTSLCCTERLNALKIGADQ